MVYKMLLNSIIIFSRCGFFSLHLGNRMILTRSIILVSTFWLLTFGMGQLLPLSLLFLLLSNNIDNALLQLIFTNLCIFQLFLIMPAFHKESLGIISCILPRLKEITRNHLTVGNETILIDIKTRHILLSLLLSIILGLFNIHIVVVVKSQICLGYLNLLNLV